MSLPLARATKIVATLGPASTSETVLTAMIAAGVNVVRLNFSHGSREAHAETATQVRAIAQRLGVEVAIMADLQGPKIRVGKFEAGSVTLQPGQAFTLDPRVGLGNTQEVGLDYPALAHDVAPGDILLLNDGLIRLQVSSVAEPAVHTEVVAGGVLADHKGINRLGGGLSAAALTAKDIDDLRVAVQFGADYLAISFPKSRTDIEMARQLAALAAEHAQQAVPQLIAKIERAEAITHLDELIDAADGIMVARGDLAVEVGAAAVPALQKKMIRRARACNRTVITATQMMESMITQPVPTRAEVSDVANAVLDGTDAVMLSGETAVGAYPVQCIEHMAAICLEAEKSQRLTLDTDFLEQTFERVDQSIAYAALFTAYHLRCAAICSLTHSGSTVRAMSRIGSSTPIYALTPRIGTQRRAALYRHVHPFRLEENLDRDHALAAAERCLLDQGVVKAGDVVVFTVGEPMGSPGGTNTLKIVRIGNR